MEDLMRYTRFYYDGKVIIDHMVTRRYRRGPLNLCHVEKVF